MGYSGVATGIGRGYTNALQRLGHDLGPVVDSQHHVGDTGGSQCLDLMLNHGLVCELDERLWVCEGLQRALVVTLCCGCAGQSRGSGERIGQRETYERSQTGAEASDENDGCTLLELLAGWLLCAHLSYLRCWGV